MATYHLLAPGRRRPPKYGTSETADAHHLNIFQRDFQLGLRNHQYFNILEAAQLKQRCASLMWSLINPMDSRTHPCIYLTLYFYRSGFPCRLDGTIHPARDAELFDPMVRPGKERAAAPADDDDAATQVTTQDSRWRAGVNRQAQQ